MEVKKQIELQELVALLNSTIQGTRTREEVSEIATRYRHMLDNDNAIYFPSSDEDLIWETILFIEGIDMKNSPTEYLFGESDIRNFLSKLLSE